MSAHQYFAYCPMLNEFETFATEAEAVAHGDVLIQEHLDEYWSDEVTNVIVGKISHRAKQTSCIERQGEIDEDGNDEAGEYWGSADYDTKCTYDMMPLESGEQS